MDYMRLTEDFEHLDLEMRDGFGIFAIDFAAFFPYIDQDDLILRASLSTDECAGGSPVINLHEECVLNNRYPNKGWLCMTMKSGRKRSKTGFFLQLPYDELNMFNYLNIEYGFEGEDMVRMSVPINIGVLETAPCAGIEVHLMLKDLNAPILTIEVREKISEYGWCPFIYSTHADDASVDRLVHLISHTKIDPITAAEWMVFDEKVYMIPCSLDSLLV